MSIMLTHLPDALAAAVSEADDRARAPARVRMSDASPPPPADDRAEADARLLRRMAAGDKAALAELYDRSSRPLYATALRVLSDATEAHDTVHDSFITLWEKPAMFESGPRTASARPCPPARPRAL